MCYRKKIKCEFEGSNPACIQCVRRNTKCVLDRKNSRRDSLKRYLSEQQANLPNRLFSVPPQYINVHVSFCVAKSAKPSHRKQYIRSLEERVEKAQALLKVAGLFDQDLIDQEELYEDNDDEQSEDDHDLVEGELNRQGVGTPPNGLKEKTRRGNGSAVFIPTNPVAVRSDRNSGSSPTPETHSSHASRPRNPAGGFLQFLPLIRADNREEWRYYGTYTTPAVSHRRVHTLPEPSSHAPQGSPLQCGQSHGKESNGLKRKRVVIASIGCCWPMDCKMNPGIIGDQTFSTIYSLHMCTNHCHRELRCFP